MLCLVQRTLTSLCTLETVAEAQMTGYVGMGKAFICCHSTKMEVYFNYSQAIFHNYHIVTQLANLYPRPRSKVGPLTHLWELGWLGRMLCSQAEIFRA